ncbi:hypothetical protein PHISCL_02884 [Aspergillus sclerotialis]|uniref:Uncharacterized protein n=1 Tax=Aspergillus sclerotialis TaxID=2070753 RepID=A0A3A2ZR61_9EURO|nr:hypothetical protein PHISCL_02884 [Aspergillus sclerotialis]
MIIRGECDNVREALSAATVTENSPNPTGLVHNPCRGGSGRRNHATHCLTEFKIHKKGEWVLNIEASSILEDQVNRVDIANKTSP